MAIILAILNYTNKGIRKKCDIYPHMLPYIPYLKVYINYVKISTYVV